MPVPAVQAQLLAPSRVLKPWLSFDPRVNLVGVLSNQSPERWGVDPGEMLHVVNGRGYRYGVNGATITYNHSEGPEGQTTAHRGVYNGLGGAGVVQVVNVRLLAGTYVFCVDMKLTSGSTSADVRIGLSSSPTAKTITGQWQSLTSQFTLEAVS